MNRRTQILWLLAASCVLAISGCDDAHDGPLADANAYGLEAADPHANHIAIPAPVRNNLGITFVRVERRRIEQTLRVPGRFEYLPTARREYRTMLPGRIELLVEQFDRVEAGSPVYRIDSPSWREMQRTLADTDSMIDKMTTKLASMDPLWAAHERHEESLVESIDVWTSRLAQLDEIREAGGGRVNQIAEARSSLASGRSELALVQEKKAELGASRTEAEAELRAAHAGMDLLLDSAASLIEIDRGVLSRVDEDGERYWRHIDTIEVLATETGVVESLGLTNGAWADQSAAVVTIVQPERLRFHASGLQSDLGVLRDGLAARIVPPTPTVSGRAVPLHDTMEGRLALGLVGDAQDRTIDLYVVPDTLSSWARPGISAQLEIVTDSTASADLAIPLAAVQRDGLAPVIFRREPDNPDEAVRIEADLGMNDGRWVAVLSGVRDGDEVVLDGAFQLMLGTSGSIEQGGHFHADGTFHEGEDE